jgi:hypothetical protein
LRTWSRFSTRFLHPGSITLLPAAGSSMTGLQAVVPCKLGAEADSWQDLTGSSLSQQWEFDIFPQDTLPRHVDLWWGHGANDNWLRRPTKINEAQEEQISRDSDRDVQKYQYSQSHSHSMWIRIKPWNGLGRSTIETANDRPYHRAATGYHIFMLWVSQDS